MIVAVDTNVIVAALAHWQENHKAARRAIDQLLAQSSLILPVHALLEAYSVLTRMPLPLRIAPMEALRLLSETFGHLPVAGLSPQDGWSLIAEFAARGIYGGRIYDAAIARASRDAGADAILTFNVRDFENLVECLQVLSP